MSRDKIVTLLLEDPAVADPRRNYPKPLKQLPVLLSEPIPNPRQGSDGTLGELIEERFVKVLTEEERRSYHGNFVDVNHYSFCSRCGHALGVDCCNGCKRRFSDDYMRFDVGGVLPPSVRRWLERQGHQFEK